MNRHRESDHHCFSSLTSSWKRCSSASAALLVIPDKAVSTLAGRMVEIWEARSLSLSARVAVGMAYEEWEVVKMVVETMAMMERSGGWRG